MLKTEPAYMGRAKSLMAGGFSLMAFVGALALGTAGAPALGGISWVMVTAGAAGVVYVIGAAAVTALVGLRAPDARALRPVTVTSHARHLPVRHLPFGGVRHLPFGGPPPDSGAR